MKVVVEFYDGTFQPYYNAVRLDHDVKRNEYTVYTMIGKTITLPKGSKILCVEEDIK